MLDRRQRREMDRIWDKNLKNWTSDKVIGGSIIRLLELNGKHSASVDFQQAKDFTTYKLGSDEWRGGIVTKDMCERAMLAVELVRLSGTAEFPRALWEAALVGQSLIAFMGSSDSTTKSISKERFMSEMHECSDHNVIGKTLPEILRGLHVDIDPEVAEFIKFLEDNGLDDIKWTSDMEDIQFNYLYELHDEQRIKTYLAEPYLAFINSVALTPLYFEKCRTLSVALAAKERKRAERKPTKKQSEVIADLKAQLKAVTEQAEADSKSYLKDAQLYHHATDMKIADLEKKIAQQEEELKVYRVAEEVEELVEEMEDELLELPTTGITFVGGHQRLVARLRNKYPDWQYIAAGDTTSTFQENNVVFLFTSYLSHKNDDRVQSQVARENYYRVTCGNNLGLVLRQLQYFYTLHERRETGEN